MIGLLYGTVNDGEKMATAVSASEALPQYRLFFMSDLNLTLSIPFLGPFAQVSVI